MFHKLAMSGAEIMLRDNRWIPANDELAVYFGVDALSGIFTKTLRVPAATRAYILQGDKATEVPQGEYELEGFFTRLNNLLRDQHAEILITRTTPLPVEFSFSDLHTTEHLKVAARFAVGLKVEHVPAFAQHFMTTPGAVTTLHLHDLLAPSVRQMAAEFIGGQSLREMGGHAGHGANLRLQLDERLQSALRLRLAEFGLAVTQVETLALRHDKYDNNRERIGSLWLVADERHVQLEHVKQLDELYSEEEWQAIWRDEQKMRSDFRRAELRQDGVVDKAELDMRAAERMQAVRARNVDLYARIVESKSREHALEQGAGAALAELEHELARRKSALKGEASAWEHVRQLAQIKMRTELELTQQEGLEARQLARQRFSHQLHLQAIQNQVARANTIGDEQHRHAMLQRLRQAELAAQDRLAELEAEHHAARFHGLSLANAARKREAERVREWEDQQQLAHQRELLREEAVKDARGQVQVAEVTTRLDTLRREGAAADALSQHEKLLRTIEADNVHARQAQALNKQAMFDEVAVEEQRLALRQREQEAAWQRELRLMEHEREAQFARWKGEYDMLQAQQAHAAELARIDIERLGVVGTMSDAGKVALAPAANAAVLAQVMKEQVRAGMSADQLRAMAEVASAENSISPLEAMRMAQERASEERAHRDAQEHKDRQHQLELLTLQNATHAHALGAQMQLGVAVAHGGWAQPAAGGYAQPAMPAAVMPPAAMQPSAVHVAALRLCANGHPAPPGQPHAKFCAECGAPLPP